jgi:hypothetical protein
MKYLFVIIAMVGAVATAASVFGVMEYESNLQALKNVAELNDAITTIKADLLGHTKYTDYLQTGKKTLQEQAKFVAASIRRDDTFVRHIQKDFKIFKTDATILVKYEAEYSFGYDLQSKKFEIKDDGLGLQILLDKPRLITAPAILKQSHEVVGSSVFINDKAAAFKIYEDLPTLIESKGKALATDEAVVALCEKRLTSFFEDFLSKQPGVKRIPPVFVAYR